MHKHSFKLIDSRNRFLFTDYVFKCQDCHITAVVDGFVLKRACLGDYPNKRKLNG